MAKIKRGTVYVVARNNGGRPTLQHALVDGTAGITKCGTVMDGWSRSFQKQPIEAILCRRRACRE